MLDVQLELAVCILELVWFLCRSFTPAASRMSVVNRDILVIGHLLRALGRT